MRVALERCKVCCSAVCQDPAECGNGTRHEGVRVALERSKVCCWLCVRTRQTVELGHEMLSALL